MQPGYHCRTECEFMTELLLDGIELRTDVLTLRLKIVKDVSLAGLDLSL